MNIDRLRRIAALAVIVGGLAGAMTFSEGFRPGGRASGEDTATVDGLIRALYESISFPAGQSPDWDRYRNLFSSASVLCVRLAPNDVRVMDRESFIASFKDRIASGAMKSFVEREIARTTESYGGIVLAMSAYAKRLNLDEPGSEARGINAFQLFYKDGRWWIASIVWQDEHPGLPIPPKYLK